MNQTPQIGRLAAALVLGGMLSTGVAAQSTPVPIDTTPRPAPAAAKKQPSSPLTVLVRITRLDGEKKISSLPFSLRVNLDGDAGTLNLADNVTVPSNKDGSDVASYPIGTSISCRATSQDDGRVRLSLSVRDSSLALAKAPGIGVSLKSVSTNSDVLVRSGETAEFFSATDQITGEVTRIEVTATLVK